MIAALVFILRDLRVSVVKNYAKQSQFVRGWATKAGAIVQNKANLQEAMWTLTAGREESYACKHGRWVCEKQSQFALPGRWCARHTLLEKRTVRNKAKLGQNGRFGEEWTLRMRWCRRTVVRAKQSQIPGIRGQTVR